MDKARAMITRVFMMVIGGKSGIIISSWGYDFRLEIRQGKKVEECSLEQWRLDILLSRYFQGWLKAAQARFLHAFM